VVHSVPSVLLQSLQGAVQGTQVKGNSLTLDQNPFGHTLIQVTLPFSTKRYGNSKGHWTQFFKVGSHLWHLELVHLVHFQEY